MDGTGWWIGGAIAVLLVSGSIVLAGSQGPDVGSVRAIPVVDAASGSNDDRPQDRNLPRFTEDDRLMRPAGWETWVMAGASMGLTYDENPRTFAPGEAPGRFLHVYVQPWAYEAFMKTGEFPQGTMFILAGSEPVSKADPARGGFYQGNLNLFEVHLKQDGIDPTGWAFYIYGANDESAEKIRGDAICYTCHADNGDHDNVFVQFYPTIRERLGLERARASDTDTRRAASPAVGVADEGGR